MPRNVEKTERSWWERHLHPLLHVPPKRIAWRITDPGRPGIPDVILNQDGVVTWLELEVAYPAKREETRMTLPHYSLVQRAHLRDWVRAGGRGYVLVREVGSWYLLDHAVPNPCDRDLLRDFTLRTGTLGEYVELVRYLTSERKET
jgi:hypothetical protein